MTTRPQVVVQRDLTLELPDGSRLAADLYRQPGREPRPTLVHRTPYGKEAEGAGSTLDALRLAEAGFNVIAQDVRGRYGSTGRFEPFRDEGGDGSRTVEWVAAQPWSTGWVGMIGRSYGGAVQWQAATAPGGRRPHAIAPEAATSDYYEGWTYQGGAFHLGFCVAWVIADLCNPADLGGADLVERVRLVEELYAEPWRAVATLATAAPYFRDWMLHPARDGYWDALGAAATRPSPPVPALSVNGWYDIFAAGTLRSHGLAGPGSRLVIGPWSHLVMDGVFPQRRYSGAGPDSLDLTDLHAAWFRALVRGQEPPGPPVLLYVMGADGWHAFDRWPPAASEAVAWHLHSGGAANSAGGDGRLSPAAPGLEPVDAFRSDPRDPVPTAGGATLTALAHLACDTGPLDQRVVEQRDDVLCYTSEALAEPVAVVGNVEAVLYVSTSVVDTDVTAKLVDVHPDGRAEILCDGIQRGRYRDSPSTARLMEPGTVYELRVAVGPVANVFRPGHRIRLDVSGSNFPRFAPNPNTGTEPFAQNASDVEVARTVVYHERRYPSRLVLPVVAGGLAPPAGPARP